MFVGMILLILALSGCGKAAGTVSGRVAHKGKPLVSGTVTLVSDSGVAVTGRINPDGTYKIEEAPIGVVRIAVKSSNAPGLPPVLVPWAPEDPENPGEEESSAIPAHYADAGKSGLTMDVAGGQQTHDINLP